MTRFDLEMLNQSMGGLANQINTTSEINNRAAADAQRLALEQEVEKNSEARNNSTEARNQRMESAQEDQYDIVNQREDDRDALAASKQKAQDATSAFSTYTAAQNKFIQDLRDNVNAYNQDPKTGYSNQIAQQTFKDHLYTLAKTSGPAEQAMLTKFQEDNAIAPMLSPAYNFANPKQPLVIHTGTDGKQFIIGNDGKPVAVPTNPPQKPDETQTIIKGPSVNDLGTATPGVTNTTATSFSYPGNPIPKTTTRIPFSASDPAAPPGVQPITAKLTATRMMMRDPAPPPGEQPFTAVPQPAAIQDPNAAPPPPSPSPSQAVAPGLPLPASAAPSAAPVVAPQRMVRVKHVASGQTGMIPESQLPAALTNGYSLP
jgi:hypothetical protein